MNAESVSLPVELQANDDEINLADLLQTLRRRWFAACLTCGGVIVVAALYTLTRTPIYEAEGQIILQNIDRTSNLAGLAETLSDPTGFTRNSNPLENEIQILRSSPLLEQVISLLPPEDPDKPLTVRGFREVINISATREADVLQLRYRSANPQLAAMTVNQLMQTYLQNSVQLSRSQTQAARQFIEEQLPRTETELRQAEQSLRQFKEVNGIVELSQEATATVSELSGLRGQISETQAQYLEAQENSSQLRQQFGMTAAQALAVGRLSESAGVQGTLRELQKVEDQLAVAATIYAEAHPELTELRNQQAALQQTLQGRVSETVGGNALASSSTQMGTFSLDLATDLVRAEVAQRSLAERLAGLQSEFAAYQNRAQILPGLEQQYRQLQRQVEVAQITYQNLLKGLQDAQLAENQTIGNARVLDPAVVPDKAVSPRILRNLTLGVFFGFISGVGVALLLETLDNRVKTVKDVRAIYNFVLLGSIPLLRESRSSLWKTNDPDSNPPLLTLRDDTHSMSSEAYRMLLANLKFVRSDQPLKVMIMTSAMPGEGKSTTVANLALAMVELGARVLIIDADFRRPSQHHLWERPNRTGLSNVLVEPSTFPYALIRNETENLDVLTAGVLPPSPVALLDSQAMRSLLENVKAQYDYVLIDTPPLAAAADALILGQMVDGVILVARPEVLNRSAAVMAREALQQAHQPVVGMVINGVIPENEADSYYYYYARSYYSGTEQPQSMATEQLRSKQ
ncbi:polysaccharide biosynthesis tyrosine autokinase [Synechococcales cyanobacterium C]|uniref:non-specific protein-tyrosine kinase n=1 Tax=Petrachloros mirabilis ULC683 TaxID=2781853 RepID=A0A8K1ZXE4_9CYAN|nr:polysaccharide biosynthesis tyrosine autokinase [Petrachloros mirabilis]NCJ07065.1 polysaccharide biosynthesis tyrosine autokinase [Petrachloros mirabilis ULC683]